jgi:hypothetical protein
MAAMNGAPRPGQRWRDRVTADVVVVLFVDGPAVTVVDVDEADGGWSRQVMPADTFTRNYELLV